MLESRAWEGVQLGRGRKEWSKLSRKRVKQMVWSLRERQQPQTLRPPVLSNAALNLS